MEKGIFLYSWERKNEKYVKMKNEKIKIYKITKIIYYSYR